MTRSLAALSWRERHGRFRALARVRTGARSRFLEAVTKQ
jgi:hypothetical protein